jgi:KaiC/GvpD/RAD55 family RecA-like ATPase
MSDAAPLPYADVAPALLEAIYDSLEVIYRSQFERASQDSICSQLREIAGRLMIEPWAKTSSAKVKNNPHILEGINVSAASRSFESLPRISRLCVEAYSRARECGASESAEDARRVIFVPSPLAILVDALTVPARPESAAYGFALARAFLFTRFETYPPSRHLPPDWHELTISDIQDIIESFRTYFSHRDNVHYTTAKPSRAVIAHFLAMTGVFTLRFGTAGKAPMKKEDAQQACLNFCAAKDFLQRKSTGTERYEFRLSAGFSDIPDAQEIINMLMGVPLPISGASTVFFGGLQKSHHDSLVISISGSAGTGKTSFVLALAASLAPYGTQCLYCTFEEDPETLKRRVWGLTPEYFRRSTLANTGTTNWFAPFSLDAAHIGSVELFADRYLQVLRKRLRPRVTSPVGTGQQLPAIAPLVVVVDSLTTLYGAEQKRDIEGFCKLVQHLRDLDCIVVLLSAEDIPKGSRLEYLVDTVIALRYEGTDSADKKPTRLFQLLKTRLQLSRPGSHVLHLSGERGVRISPQLPSQLDARKIHKVPLPDRDCIIDTLHVDTVPAINISRERLVDVYRRSRILIHGHGSSGKAPFALKLLMAPPVPRLGNSDTGNMPAHNPRILTISFLYPEAYYDETVARVGKVLRRNSKNYIQPEVKPMVLTPGFIRPEDFIARVLTEMDRGRFEGRPYTGVLLDGLHNVFLQFPALQASDMVWPTLYNLLARYDLTVVTTFTTFSALDRPTSLDFADSDILLKGQFPFLHALVQATDFYLQVEPRGQPAHDRRFQVRVKSAIGQPIPDRALIWNADDFSFEASEMIGSAQQSLF